MASLQRTVALPCLYLNSCVAQVLKKRRQFLLCLLKWLRKGKGRRCILLGFFILLGEQEGNEGERDKKEAKEEEEEDKGMNELPSDENNDENDDDDDGGKDSTKNDKADADFENNEIPEDLELENDGANEDEGNFEGNFDQTIIIDYPFLCYINNQLTNSL